MFGLQLSYGKEALSVGLEGCGSTIELYPHFKSLALVLTPAFTGRLQRAQADPQTIPQGYGLIQDLAASGTYSERKANT